MFPRTLACILILSSACAESEGDTGEVRTDARVDGDAGGPPAPGPDGAIAVPESRAPIIIQIVSSGRILRENGILVITAIVSDPDGIGDVIGGTLADAEGFGYGAFLSSADEGAYERRLTWGEIHAIHPIAGLSQSRTFVATFFDQAGHRVRAALEIEFACENSGEIYCAGTCFNPQTAREHCGQCGNDCWETDEDAICAEGLCWALVDQEYADPCNEFCGSRGARCGPHCRAWGTPRQSVQYQVNGSAERSRDCGDPQHPASWNVSCCCGS